MMENQSAYQAYLDSHEEAYQDATSAAWDTRSAFLSREELYSLSNQTIHQSNPHHHENQSARITSH
jgi:hypothetical protein